ncbi:hypothetical protein B0H11DRAFT_2186943 [Mycena galericulata]|nr:hypothetical protein B0H11DRAFT_2186943 [Mycena galericulata]
MSHPEPQIHGEALAEQVARNRGGDGGRGEGPRITAEERPGELEDTARMSYSRPQIIGGRGGAGGRGSTTGGNGGRGGEGGLGGDGDTKGGDGGVGERASYTEPFLPPGTQLPDMTVEEFCERYKLNSGPTVPVLAAQGFKTVKQLSNARSITLQDVGLGIGHIAELKAALETLAYDTSVGTQ